MLSVWIWESVDDGGLLASLDPEPGVTPGSVELPVTPRRVERLLAAYLRADSLDAGKRRGAWPEVPFWIWREESGEVWACADKPPNAPPAVMLDVPRDPMARATVRDSCARRILSLTGARSVPEARRMVTAGAAPRSPVTTVVSPTEAPDTQPTPTPAASQSWLGIREEMSAALISEAVTVRSKRPSTDIRLSDGSEIARSADRLVVRYTAANEISDAPGSDVQVELWGVWYDAELISVVGDQCTLALPKEARPSPDARLRVDAAHLLQLQIEHLQALPPSFDISAAESVLDVAGAGELGPSVLEGSRQMPAWGCLNAEQLSAIQTCARSGTTWLWGPPGTGKTTTVAGLVEALRQHNHRVLIVSNTNAAVDAALLAYLEMVRLETSRMPGEVLRVGMSGSPDLIAATPHPVLLVEELRRRGLPLAAQRDRCQEALAAARNELDEARTQESRLVAMRREVAAPTRQLTLLLTKIDEADSAFHTAAERAQVVDFRAAAGSRDAVERAQARQGVADRAERAVNALRLRERSLRQEVKNRAAELIPIERNLAQARKQVGQRFAAVADQQAELKRIDAQIDGLEAQVMAGARVVFATVHQTYLKRLAGLRFDVVIVDEASMVSLPLAMFAAGLGSGHTVFAGDFRQLGPIAQSEAPHAIRWLSRSAFDAAGVPQRVRERADVPGLVALEQQYRMRPTICGLVSSAYYPERGLRTAESVIARPVDKHLALMLDNELMVVDTSRLVPWTARPSSQRSRFNAVHSLVAAALIESLAESTVSVGLIAPYAPQARLLTATVKDLGMTNAEAATVHRFQGGERDLIVYDTTESRGCDPTKWFTDGRLDGDGAQLMNVAFSRARDRLVVMANMCVLSPKLAGDATLRAFAALRRSGRTVDAIEVLRASQSVSASIGPAGLQHVIDAVANASNSVTVWTSGFGSGDLAHAAVDALVARSAEGVPIEVWAHPARNAAERAAQERLYASEVDLSLIDHSYRENLVVADQTLIVAGHPILSAPSDGWVVSGSGAHLVEALRRQLVRDRRGRTVAKPCVECGRPMGLVERRGDSWLSCLWCNAAHIEERRPQAQRSLSSAGVGTSSLPKMDWLYDY